MKAKRCSRDKAFLGAAIAGVSAISNIVGGIVRRKREQKQMEEQARIQREQQMVNTNIQNANALSTAYANQDYVDEYKNKVTLKQGGKMKTKTDMSDRISRSKRFACGGRRKASLGATATDSFNRSTSIDSGNGLVNNIIRPSVNSMRCGGLKRKKCGGKS